MRDNFLTEVTHLFLLKGKWQQKFLLSHLKETLKIIYRSILQKFYICFTLGDIRHLGLIFNLINNVLVTSQKG